MEIDDLWFDLPIQDGGSVHGYVSHNQRVVPNFDFSGSHNNLQLWPFMKVITGYFSGIKNMLFLWGDFLVLITGITRAITAGSHRPTVHPRHPRRREKWPAESCGPPRDLLERRGYGTAAGNCRTGQNALGRARCHGEEKFIGFGEGLIKMGIWWNMVGNFLHHGKIYEISWGML